MQFSLLLTALSATAVLAAPIEKRAETTTWVVDVVTSYTTVYASSIQTPAPVSSSAPAPAIVSPIAAVQQPAAPSFTIPKPVIPKPSISIPAISAPSPPAQAGACPNSVPTDFSSDFDSCGVSVLATANKWRAAYGKPLFTWASNLGSAAQTTVSKNKGGVTMVHPGLIDNSFAETISPGFWQTGSLATQGESPFEVAVVNWLCEVSSDPELQASGFSGIDQCYISKHIAGISGSADPSEPTGHHDIFLSDDYKTIGCAFEYNVNGDGGNDQWTGQWACDFGY